MKPKVEIYWDSSGRMGGEKGCYRARLAEDHGVHDAGSKAKIAFDNFLRTAKSLGHSGEANDYEVVLI